VLRIILRLGMRMNPTLKKRSFQSDERSLSLRHDEAIPFARQLPIPSSPHREIDGALARNLACRIDTSSLKACSALPGSASRRTGMLKPESQLAALVRCSSARGDFDVLAGGIPRMWAQDRRQYMLNHGFPC